MRVNSIRLTVLAVAAMTTAGFAQAGTNEVDFAKLGVKQQAHYLKMAERHQVTSPEYNYDIRPAQLRRVGVNGKVDASRKFAQAVVSLTATDNLSGVNYITVTLIGPSGQTAYTTWYNPFASKRAEVELAVDMADATENGTWRIYSVNVRDSNDYGTYYDEAALAAMGGRTTFTVVGAVGDQTAPTVQAGGVNLTPTVSRATPPGGMLPGAEARVGVQLNLADTGAAGVRSASLTYCLNGDYWSDCFYVQASNYVRGKSTLALTLGGHVSTQQTTGTYLPTVLNIDDNSGNSSYYARYNGNDLDSLIDVPAIVINE